MRVARRRPCGRGAERPLGAAGGLGGTAPGAASAADAAAPAATAAAPLALPQKTLYTCVKESGAAREMLPIVYEPKVEKLCRRHPEMGPCQYERQNCRVAGGRVFAYTGEEITMKTEEEYDKKVIRVRFQTR
jgi:hypothetical protein